MKNQEKENPEDEHSLVRLEPRSSPSSDNIFRLNSPIMPFGEGVLPFGSLVKNRILALFRRKDVIRDFADLPHRIGTEKVVSLDFFDTLATRPVEPPEYVFQKIAELSVALIQRSHGFLLSTEEYLIGRHLCELSLRKRSRVSGGLDEEIDLRSILNRFLVQKGIHSPGLVEDLLELEAELEADILSIGEQEKEVLRKLKQEGRRILVLSDMYLTESQFKLILKRHEIEPYVDRIYISGDIGLAKYSGKLFNHVLECEGVNKNDFVHIGDNARSDFRSPSLLGIEAKWLVRHKELRRRYRVRKSLRRNPSRFVGRIIEEKSRKLYQPEQVFERALYTQIMPGIFTMAYRVIQDCQRLKVTRLYFLSREGITLKKAFDLLLEKHPDFREAEIYTSILYCSRESSVAARYAGLADVDGLVEPVFERFDTLTLNRFLGTWGLEKADVGWPDQPGDETISIQCLKNLLIQNPVVADKLDKALSTRLASIMGYVVLQGVLDQDCMLVDVGWGGTIQKNLEALGGGNKIYGAYLATDARFEAKDLQGYLFNMADYRTGAVWKSAAVTETLLSVSGVGTTTSYKHNDQGIEPNFAESAGIPMNLEKLRDQVLQEFYSTFEEVTRHYCTPIEVLISHSRDRWFKFHCHPRKDVLNVMRQMTFNLDWGLRDSSDLLTSLSLADWLRPHQLGNRLWNSPWVFGNLVAVRLGFLNTPISWLLTEEGRINKRSVKKVLRRVLNKTGS